MPAGRPDVVVVGGGIIGLAVARELARRGRSVALVERGSPGREATWAAAGMLSPLGEAAQDPALHRLADASLDLWPALSNALLEETGADVAYRTDGAIHVAERPDEVAALHALAARAGSGARII